MDQMLHKRPGNRFADVEGLYLAGGGTHPGSGLPVIYESARISSDLLCQDLGISGSERDPGEPGPTEKTESKLNEDEDHAAA